MKMPINSTDFIFLKKNKYITFLEMCLDNLNLNQIIREMEDTEHFIMEKFQRLIHIFINITEIILYVALNYRYNLN